MGVLSKGLKVQIGYLKFFLKKIIKMSLLKKKKN